jgi:hypothetical protein
MSPFTTALESMGFFVGKRSTSNYDFTSLSLASSLNATHLTSLEENSTDMGPVRDLITSSGISEVFRAGGYRIIQIGSWWQIRSSDSLGQSRWRYRFLNEFNMVLIDTSILAVIEEPLLAPLTRASVLDGFDSIESAARLPGRKFVFAHIISPHPPLLFARDGSPVGLFKSISGKFNARSGYLDQSIFVADRIVRTVKEVLRRSVRQPVIILQSDHGSGTVLHHTALDGLGSPTTDFLREQFSILNAFLVPPELHRDLYDTISPVNTFRVLLNHWTEPTLPLLEDRSYFSTYSFPFQFQDVTEIVQYRAE